MQAGERNPVRDSAASSNARDAAVSASLAETFDEPGPDTEPSAAEPAPATSEALDAGTTEPVSVAESEGASQGQPDPAVSTETQLAAPKHWPKDRQSEFTTL